MLLSRTNRWPGLVAVACMVALSWLAVGEAWADHAEDVVAKMSEALSDDNLATAAAGTDDAETIIGLAAFASPATGSKIAARAVSIAPDTAKAAAALGCGWRLDAQTVGAFQKADPSNAAPYYLQAALFLEAGKDAEGLEAFRKGVACATFDTHTGEIARGALKAMSALGFDETEKTLALTRLYLPKGRPMYPAWFGKMVSVVSGGEKAAARAGSTAPFAADVSKMAEQMLGSPDAGRYEVVYAVRHAILKSYDIRAAAGSVTRTEAFTANTLREYNVIFPSIQGRSLDSLDTALNRLLEPMPTVKSVFGYEPALSPQDATKVDETLAEVEKARAKILAAAPAALAVVSAQAIDGSMAARASIGAAGAWVSLFLTAQNSEKAYLDLLNLPRHITGPESKSNLNLAIIGMTALMYSADHDGALPPDLNTLVTLNILKDKNAVSSPITGKPYVYLGKGLTDGAPATYVLAYDEAVLKPDNRMALFADAHVGVIAAAELEELLKKQGK